MRTIIILLTIVLSVGLLAASDADPRVTRVLEGFDSSVATAQQRRDAAIQAAEQAFATAATAARTTAVRDLKRLVNNRTDAATTAVVYREVLTLDQADADARRFFEAIGTLDQVLAGITPRVETDLLGNVVGAQETLGSTISPRMGILTAESLLTWRATLWTGRWNQNPLSRMTVESLSSGREPVVKVTNSSGVHGFARLDLTNEALVGDFEFAIAVTDPKRIALYSNDGRDNFISIPIGNSGEINTYLVRRVAGVITAHVNGKEVQVPTSRLLPDAPMIPCVEIVSNREITIHRFYIQRH